MTAPTPTSTRHTVVDGAKIIRREIPADLTQHDYQAVGHVLAAMVAQPFHNCAGARVANGKPLTAHAVEERFAAGGAVQDHVADQNIFFRDEGGILRRIDDQTSAREPLTHVVVRFALEFEGDTMGQECPEALACSAAARLFDLPAVQAASELPFASDAFDVAWCLGVLCTVADQAALLAELRRVITDTGRLGLLVFVAQVDELSDAPEGNNFPTTSRLASLLEGAGFAVDATVAVDDLERPPPDWSDRAAEVERALADRHRGDPQWEKADRQSALIGELLKSGDVVGTLIVARPLV